MSTNQVIVDAKVYDTFVEKLVIRTKNIVYGDPEQGILSLARLLMGHKLKIKHIIAQALQRGD